MSAGTPLPATCQVCGLKFRSGSEILITGTASLSDVGVRCPRCGGNARITDGTYNYLGQLIDTLKNATDDQVKQLDWIARAAQDGSISQTTAKREADRILPGLGRLLLPYITTGTLALLVALISLYIQIQDSNSSSNFQDRILAEIHGWRVDQTELFQQHEKMDALERQREQLRSNQRQETNRASQPLTSGVGPNRHERRKAAKLNRT